MPQGSILQKITQWPSSCRSSAPCQALAINVTKWNTTQFASYYFPWLIWLDIHRNHIKMQGSLRNIYIRGWPQQQTAVWVVIFLLFNRVQEWSFVPQTTLILTSMCILISLRYKQTSSALDKEAVDNRSLLSRHNEDAGSAHLGCWHPKLGFDSALRSSTNTCCPKRLWISQLWKCPRPRVSYAHMDIYIIKHTTLISKQNKLQRHKPI